MNSKKHLQPRSSISHSQLSFYPRLPPHLLFPQVLRLPLYFIPLTSCFCFVFSSAPCLSLFFKNILICFLSASQPWCQLIRPGRSIAVPVARTPYLSLVFPAAFVAASHSFSPLIFILSSNSSHSKVAMQLIVMYTNVIVYITSIQTYKQKFTQLEPYTHI